MNFKKNRQPEISLFLLFLLAIALPFSFKASRNVANVYQYATNPLGVATTTPLPTLGLGELNNIKIFITDPIYSTATSPNFTRVTFHVTGIGVSSFNSLTGKYYYGSTPKTFTLTKVGTELSGRIDLYGPDIIEFYSPNGLYLASLCLATNMYGINQGDYLYGPKCGSVANVRIFYNYPNYIYKNKLSAVAYSLPYTKIQTPSFKPTNVFFILQSPTGFTNVEPWITPNNSSMCSQPTAKMMVFSSFEDTSPQYYDLINAYSCMFRTPYGQPLNEFIFNNKYLTILPWFGPTPSPIPTITPTPTPTPTSIPTPTPQQFIKVDAPNGGEILTVGSTTTIIWSSVGITLVSLDLIDQSGFGSGIALNISSVPNTLTWVVQKTYHQPNQSWFKIRIIGDQNPNISDLSDDYFTINSILPTPTNTPIPTSTLTPTPRPSNIPTLTLSPTKRPTPTPTRRPTPTPTIRIGRCGTAYLRYCALRHMLCQRINNRDTCVPYKK